MGPEHSRYRLHHAPLDGYVFWQAVVPDFFACSSLCVRRQCNERTAEHMVHRHAGKAAGAFDRWFLKQGKNSGLSSTAIAPSETSYHIVF